MTPLRTRRNFCLAGALVAASALWLGWAHPAHSGEKDTTRIDPASEAYFETRVQPILTARCLKCHGGEAKIKGNFRIDSRAAVLRGGDQGPAVTLERPEESLLLQAIHYDGLEMPPSGKLPAPEIDILTRGSRKVWRGLWPIGSRPPRPRPSLLPASLRHGGAMAPSCVPPLPTVKNPGWVRNPIDALLLGRLEAEGLEPAPPAERAALIRRVTYDLTGLPPAPEEVDAFVTDPSTDAYERLVDRLLASAHHGEAWGRHWLDLVRYAETNGYERDSAKPQAWRYRDYVIQAFNQDKPYDQFVREQLAGDEIDPSSAEALIATGFYRLGLWDDEPADRELAHFDGLDGILATAGQVFLGVSINCARCHDHKKDPLPQADYYRLLSFFADVTNQDGKNTGASTATPASKSCVCVSTGKPRPMSCSEAIPGCPAPRSSQVFRRCSARIT